MPATGKWDTSGRQCIYNDAEKPLIVGDVGGNTVNVSLVDASYALDVNVVQNLSNPVRVVSETLTRPADTTAYAANDIVSDATTGSAMLVWADVVASNGQSGTIIGVRILTDQAACTATFRLHLFNANNPTVNDDNEASAVLYADAAKYIGYVDVGALQTSGAGSTAAYGQTSICMSTLPLAFDTGAATTSIWGKLETLSAFTPASGQNFEILIGTI